MGNLLSTIIGPWEDSMTDSSTGDGSQTIPDIRLLFDLVRSNNLDAICSLLTPLTLRDRLLVVYQRVDGKTLLYRACEFGFRDIAKYLLDECGADVDDGYCDCSFSSSPLRLALKKNDVFMMSILMRRRATVRESNYTISCIYYAFKLNYFVLMSLLIMYKNNIQGQSLLASRVVIPGHTRSPSFGVSLLRLNTEDMNFLSAAAAGNIPEMKKQLSLGANKYSKNFIEENALCQTILSGRWNARNFLMGYRTFTLKEYALALELCGAKFIVFRLNEKKGFECWRQSITIRQENNIGFLDKNHVQTEIDIGIEFRTREEIDGLRNENVYFQALLVFLRMLTRSNAVTRSAFRKVALHKIFANDLMMSLNLLSELYSYVGVDNSRIRYPIENALESMDELLSSHFKIRFKSKTKDLLSFRRLFDFLDDTWGTVTVSNAFYDIAYEQLLAYVLQNIDRMFQYDLTEEEQQWIQRRVALINVQCPPRYPTSLLHEAICRQSPLQVVSLVLKSSADANIRNRQNNTPLHVVSEIYSRNTYSTNVTNQLLAAGAHIDSVNCNGIRPMESLTKRGIIQNPLQHLSLQCLAAQTIYKAGIVVPEDDYPKPLVKFIELHSE